ncbi:hypothetical protein P280DRAFT_474443 [Massarina eburnea CBS 473.64]|uniref:SPT2-domain-containing protein n=1 Tax=Massarina eburnea CBS 473.64 TaxID=1395130 RepID=A0A6A6RHK1_9PLEO|nr:hypothetical protein P280DRAFT_474443 [Massarina eburnea CBS 473.64]
MSLFKDLISQIDQPGSVAPSAPSPVQRLASGSPKPAAKPAPRTTTPTNGASEPQTLKRKASSTIENAQAKTQRKDAPAPPRQPNSAARNPPTPASVKPSLSVATTSMPYRGTAGLGAPKPSTVVKRPSPHNATPAPIPKSAAPAPKPAASKPSVACSSTANSAPAKKSGGYLAMLMKAKEKDKTKPATPPVKIEPAKILTKKERSEAKLAAKGKKPAVAPPTKAANTKLNGAKETRKPANVGYQGTARPTTAPAKKAVEIAYKGTARPSSAAGPAGRPAVAAKPKSKFRNEYARWSDDEDDEEIEEPEEEDEGTYDSGSDNMEGGTFWDMEEEEAAALKVAKKEDQEQLALEMRLKREKEARKKKLSAMATAAAGKRKYSY